MSQQRLELNHLASTSRLPTLPLQGRTSGESHRDLYRHLGSADVIFPAEIWLLVLGNLALRDLHSLTVTSKFFYNSFTSIYRNRVAHEGIPRRERPTLARMPYIFVLIYPITLIEAILAGILIAKSPDLSHMAGSIYIVIVCCYSLGMAFVFLLPFSASRWTKLCAIYLWAFWLLLWSAATIIASDVLGKNDCGSDLIESQKTAALYCGLWQPVVAFIWIEWSLVLAAPCSVAGLMIVLSVIDTRSENGRAS